jgi:hypothetical protein
MHLHKWIIVSKEIQPSPWDEMVKSGATKIEWKGDPKESTRRECIVSYKCNECGSEKVERI